MQQNNIKEKIMEKIVSGKVKVKPKLYFVIKAAGFAALWVVCFLIAVFLASFVVFAAKFNGPIALLLILTLAALIFVLINFILVKKFPYFYQKPLLFALLILIALTCSSSLLILQTPFHQKMLEISKQKNIPVISPLYKCGCGCGCASQTICSCQKENGQCHMK